MLQTLTVRHFVIVEHLELDFAQGFTVMTGETGAGKSILIDALDLILGGRADAMVVREGAPRADLSATFDVQQLAPINAWLHESDLASDDGHLILRRTVDASGKSKAWINGQPVTLAQLRQAGEFLVDIHGQHAHQALLRPNAQRQLLDLHAGLTSQVKAVSDAWREWQQVKESLEAASVKAAQLTDIKERLSWKIEEIASLRLAPGEWEQLSDEQKRLAHGAELLQTAQSALGLLEDNDNALVSSTESLSHRLRQLIDKDPRLAPAADALDQAAIQLQEAASLLSKYLDKTDLDPARLAQVESRVDAIFTVASKLRTKPEFLLELLASAQAELAAAEEAADIESLKRREAERQSQYQTAAKALSKSRALACKGLSKEVNHWFSQLAMGGMEFQAICEPRDKPAASGMEDIVLMLKSHATGAPYPISKVASGGELARISLAISVVTSSANKVPTLIFDEVDSGIGGNVAHTVGQLLRSLGSDRQVLCVTHLPQVAARGHQHFQVSKQLGEDGKPMSQLIALDAAARVEEIARMLGDKGAQETSREHARSLLALA
jgi:DNA repair protein RecN (Recombination protein N)